MKNNHISKYLINLRQINGGAYPKNISPVLYVVPLILVGVAEWYVNFATFAEIFIPVFAIAGTLLVAAACCVGEPYAWHVSEAACRNYSPIYGV